MTKPVVTTILGVILLAASAGTMVHRDPRAVSYEMRVERLESQVSKLTGRVSALEKKSHTFNLPAKGREPAASPLQKKVSKGPAKPFWAVSKVGQAGYITSLNKPTVYQIIDGQNMLIEITIGYRTYSSGRLAPVESRFLTRAPSYRGPSEPIRKTVWIRGVPTAGLVDDAIPSLPTMLKVTGTKSYGASTVLLLEPVPGESR